MSEEIRVQLVEFDGENLIIGYVLEPRMSSTGAPIVTSKTLSISMEDESFRPIIDEFVEISSALARDLLEATSDENTKSLEEFAEEAEDDPDMDLGLGDLNYPGMES